MPPQALELDSKYVKAWAKKGDIEFFMKEYHKALDSYKMVGQVFDFMIICSIFYYSRELILYSAQPARRPTIIYSSKRFDK